MSTYTDSAGPGAAILSEIDHLSREVETIASGAGVVANNTILGKVTASGKYLPWNPAATDGSETAAAMAINGCDATSADQEVVVIARLAALKEPEIVYPGTATAGEVDAMKASLASANIIVR